MSKRLRWLGALLFALSLGSDSTVRGRSSTGELKPEVLETYFRMRVIAAALDTVAVGGHYPGPTAGLVPISSVADELEERTKGFRGPLRDVWKGPILYWSDGKAYLLLSYGADGKAEFDYSAMPPYANVSKGWAGVDPNDDLLIVSGVGYRGPISQSEFLLLAGAAMRSIGTACESYAVDNNMYPGPVDPTGDLASVEAELQPIYIKVLPELDPWGHPYRYWSDRNGYAVVSYGPDGVPDFPYDNWGKADFEALQTGPTTRTGQDLVWVNGRFVQWPAVLINSY